MRSAGDAAILCRTREFLTTASLTGGNGFWYQFTATPIASLNMDRLPYMGSFHGAEVPFVFGFPAELSSDGERALSKAMGCYWVNFASTGNPNFGPASCGNLPEWREISTTEGSPCRRVCRCAALLTAVCTDRYPRRSCDSVFEYFYQGG